MRKLRNPRLRCGNSTRSKNGRSPDLGGLVQLALEIMPRKHRAEVPDP
jgi:hypothetical protein